MKKTGWTYGPMTREQWLIEAAAKLEPYLKAAGGKLPPLRYSVGFPVGKRTAIGQAWSVACSASGHAEIFISPVLDDPARVMDVLLHEMIHPAVGNECGHKGPFRKLAMACGLTGKMTATIAGPELKAKIAGWLSDLPPFPHSKLTPSEKEKKQSTRMLKAECASCGYTIRLAKKWADLGLPCCPVCLQSNDVSFAREHILVLADVMGD